MLLWSDNVVSSAHRSAGRELGALLSAKPATTLGSFPDHKVFKHLLLQGYLKSNKLETGDMGEGT